MIRRQTLESLYAEKLGCFETEMLLSAISPKQPSDPRILDPLDPNLNNLLPVFDFQDFFLGSLCYGRVG